MWPIRYLKTTETSYCVQFYNDFDFVRNCSGCNVQGRGINEDITFCNKQAVVYRYEKKYVTTREEKGSWWRSYVRRRRTRRRMRGQENQQWTYDCYYITYDKAVQLVCDYVWRNRWRSETRSHKSVCNYQFDLQLVLMNSLFDQSVLCS